MPYTMEDFRHDFVKRHFKDLTPEERQEALQGLPAAELEAMIEEYQRRRREAATPPPEQAKGGRTGRRQSKQ
jgi:hypothetical protein